jgi:hypothetical protein
MMANKRKNVSTGDLWAVTSYQNSCKYGSRLRNFKIFRDKLDVPLLVVEICRTGAFELTPQDGDIVIQLIAEDRLWQKERLINIGIQALPATAQYVAWLDCDIVFETNEWVTEVCEKLRGGFDLVQPFSGVIHQTSEEKAQFSDASDFSKEANEPSAGFAIAEEEFTFNQHTDRADFAPGHAWCSTRALMEKHPLYDRMICGGGDTIHLAASLGWLDGVLKGIDTSTHHLEDIKRHYLSAPRSEISYSSNKLFHLYHGDFRNRKYLDRQKMLNTTDFNPNLHLVSQPGKPLEYSPEGNDICALIDGYLHARREDD